MSLSTLAHGGRQPRGSGPQRSVRRAVVTKSPESLTDPVRVMFPDISMEPEYQCKWVAYPGGLPPVGASGKVIFDNTGDAVVIYWDDRPFPVEVTGSVDDGSALASLLDALAGLGLITDSTS